MLFTLFLIQYCLIITSNAYTSISAELLNRRVKSATHNLFDKDENGNCYYPPFCKLNVSKCNVDKIPFKEMTLAKYYNEYYLRQKPVIIQFCNDNDCVFSSIIDNSSHIFEYRKMARLLLGGRKYMQLLFQEHNTNMLKRQEFTVIMEIDSRGNDLEKSIYKSFKRPDFLNEIDIYQDLLGFLHTSDQHSLLSNNWVIVGVKSGGATFHADFYGVSLWHILLEGSKYWVLMAPDDVLNIWNNSIETISEVQALRNYEWFENIYLNGFLDVEYKRIGNGHTYYHCLQEKGDFLLAPELFYHITVNLDKSLAVGQAMIAKEQYKYIFNAFGTKKENPHKMLDRDYNGMATNYALLDGGKLCISLYHYNQSLWRNSMCSDQEYITQLNGYKYKKSLKYAENHPQYTDFV